MARYTGPVCRLCRREGTKLFLKGARCYSKKCAVERRPTPPGQHGVRRRKQSEFGVQLREKQKVRRVYSVLERQFRTYFDEAESRPGVTGQNLLRCSRRASTTSPSGWASRPAGAQARQLVNHGHFLVNGRKADVASYRLRPGDRIEVRERSRSTATFKTASETLRTAQVPEWLSVEPDKLAGSVTALPRRDQMPAELNEQLVVEFYSR